MTHQELYEIALHAAKGTVPAVFAKEGTQVDVNAAFVDGLKELAGSVNQFMKNRYDIYDIVIKVADEVMPKKVIDALGLFAGTGCSSRTKKLFKKKLGRSRAKSS